MSSQTIRLCSRRDLSRVAGGSGWSGKSECRKAALAAWRPAARACCPCRRRRSAGAAATLRTEPELNERFADISLEPLVAQYPALRHGFLVELKYIKRSDDASEERLQKLTQEAGERLRLRQRRRSEGELR